MCTGRAVCCQKNTLQECFAFSSTLKNILVFMGFHGRNLAQASIQSMLFAKDTKPPDVVKMFVSNAIIYGPKPETEFRCNATDPESCGTIMLCSSFIGKSLKILLGSNHISL